MKQEKWFDRKFSYGNSQNIFPAVIERLSGTPARLEEKLKDIPVEALTLAPDNSWTIKENLGHLLDLEPLWQGRLEDLLTGQPEMRSTDLQNNQTYQANHNDTPLETLLCGFREIRQQTLKQLQLLTDESLIQSALHPRLKTPMNITDLFVFVAEHDDHHLARITALIGLSAKALWDESAVQQKTTKSKRVKFDFETHFTNGGSLRGTEFRLDIDHDNISDEALADYIARDLRLLLVRDTKITKKEIINENHKRT